MEPKKEVKKEENKGLKLKSVQVHQVATIRNATETSFHAHKGYELYYTPDGVFAEYKELRFIIPLANVVVAILAE